MRFQQAVRRRLVAPDHAEGKPSLAGLAAGSWPLRNFVAQKGSHLRNSVLSTAKKYEIEELGQHCCPIYGRRADRFGIVSDALRISLVRGSGPEVCRAG